MAALGRLPVPLTRANRVLEVLRKALNLSIEWEWITRNPADGFRRNTEHSREKYLTADEYERVFAALKKMTNQKAANAIRLLILTGARRGEVLGLEWPDLDLELGIWNRPPHKSKDRKRKRIPLSNEALMLLRGIPVYGMKLLSTASSPVVVALGTAIHCVCWTKAIEFG